MVDLCSKKNNKIQIVSQTSDLLTNVFDIDFRLAQGIKQY